MLGKFKSMLFEEDPSAAKPEANPSQPATHVANIPPVGSGAKPPQSTGYFNPNPVNPEMLEKLRGVAFGRATPFKTLQEAMDKMASVIPDETMRAQAAYASISNDARTPTQILQSLDIHLQDLAGEQTRFASLTEVKRRNDLVAIDTTITKASTAMSTLGAEIEALQRQAQEKQNQIMQLSTELHNAEMEKSTIDIRNSQVAAEFDQAYNTVKAELETKRQIFQNIFK